MSGRAIVANGALLALLLLVVLWLLRLEPSSPGADTAPPSSGSRLDADPRIVADFPAISLREPAGDPGRAPDDPLELPVAPLSPAMPLVAPADVQNPSTPTHLLVGALTSEGAPFADVLAQRWPQWPRLQVAVTTDLTGASARSRRLQFGLPLVAGDQEPEITTESVSVPGYLCSLTVDDQLPLLVILHLQSVLVATQIVQPDSDSVWFTLEPADIEALAGSVKGRVVAAATGAPVPQGQVALKDQRVFTLFSHQEKEYPLTAGAFELDGVPAGTAYLRIGAEGYETVTLKTQVPHGRGVDLGTIELEEGLACTGRVVSPEGTPMKASVTLRPIDENCDWFDFLMMYSGDSTDDEGRFRLGPIGRDRYLLAAHSRPSKDGPRLVGRQIIDASVGPISDLTLTLQPATSVTLEGVTEGHQWTELAIADESGVLLASFNAEILRATLEQKSRKRPFTLDVVPGRYTLELAQGSRIVWTHPFEVTAEPLTITLP